MDFWDTRFSETGYAYGVEPNDFLRASAHHLPAGEVLCLAEGEGRNATFLAKLGYRVHAIDLSAVGLQKAAALAQSQGVTITTEVADLSTRKLESGRWQGIVSIWAHMPSVLRASLHGQVVDALAPGGVFILEAYTPRHLQMPGVGGPKDIDMLMPLDRLREELRGLDLVVAQETERDVKEGRYHTGASAVVQVVGRKG